MPWTRDGIHDYVNVPGFSQRNFWQITVCRIHYNNKRINIYVNTLLLWLISIPGFGIGFLYYAGYFY